MKRAWKINLLLWVFTTFILMGVGLMGCSTSKSGQKNLGARFKDHTIKMDSTSILVPGWGESINITMAKEIAETNAQKNLTSRIASLTEKIMKAYKNHQTMDPGIIEDAPQITGGKGCLFTLIKISDSQTTKSDKAKKYQSFAIAQIKTDSLGQCICNGKVRVRSAWGGKITTQKIARFDTTLCKRLYRQTINEMYQSHKKQAKP